MRVVETVTLFDRLRDGTRILADAQLDEIRTAASELHWGSTDGRFVINPTIRANGVKPIKVAFAELLRLRGWTLEASLWSRGGPGKFDAQKDEGHVRTVVEWET